VRVFPARPCAQPGVSLAIHLLPQLWFRNTWPWKTGIAKPDISRTNRGVLAAHHAEFGDYNFYADGRPEILSCDNETNIRRLYGCNEATGNSNWRGPVWMPMNFLIIEALQKFHHYYGDDFKVECPTGSGQFMTLNDVANELSRRLEKLFLKGPDGQRPVLKYHSKLAGDPHFKDYLLFHEYFHGDSGRGVGASHQTGWTGLVAKLLQPRRASTRPEDTIFVTRPPAAQPAESAE
jgi:hypothetical protein